MLEVPEVLTVLVPECWCRRCRVLGVEVLGVLVAERGPPGGGGGAGW